MPKMKTNSGAKKRLMRRGDGSLKRKSANRRHLLTKKSQKVKTQSRGPQNLSPSDVNNGLRMLCAK